MDLYIANTTKQNVAFYYRVPESVALREQTIRVGSQERISGNLSTPDIDAIIAQHAPYGMVSADELDRVKGFVGLCYSVGKPIPAAKIERAMNENISVLIRRGKETREMGAIASSVAIENTLAEQSRPEILKEFDASIVEENPDARGDAGGPAISEGVRVNRLADPDGHVPPQSGRSAGKRRRAA